MTSPSADEPNPSAPGPTSPTGPSAPAEFGIETRPPNLACRAFSKPPPTGAPRFIDPWPTVNVNTPVGLAHKPGDSSRWYVIERAGRIVHFPNRAGAGSADVRVVLDLRDVTFAGADCSMNSLAFAPNFATSGVAYVAYCYSGPETANQLQLRYSRFKSNDGGDTFDRASEQLIVTLDFPYDHDNVGLHSADSMRFGPDSFLYMTLGDGGPFGRLGADHSQDTFDLRGKMLRIDVSDPSLELTKDFVPDRRRVAAKYPADNPFVTRGGHPAVFAFGFRNPWQWSFDRKDGSIWVGDVGGSTWEEVNRKVKNGGNYGWGALEGPLCVNAHTPEECANPAFIPPFLVYHHGDGPQDGDAITGGIVYRGNDVPTLNGAYIFGDSSGARVWAIKNVDAIPSGAPMPDKQLLSEGIAAGAFAEDVDGELYVAMLYRSAQFPAGHILKLVVEEADPTPGAGPPKLLSETGCFDASGPAPDLIPFEPAAQLWSDGATKRRWFMVPDGKQITVKVDGDFEFPVGSVLVKEFSLGGKKIEHRFLVRQEVDGQWAGYSYRWNDDETDATLVPATGASRQLGAQTWSYPGQAQCSRCHTQVAGNTLGPEVGQLNHAMDYDGHVSNQMKTLDHIGLLAFDSTAEWPSFPKTDDKSLSVGERARSYLHANCSSCHRPGGPTFTTPDYRFSTPLADMGICNAPARISDLGIQNARILAPADASASIMHVRMITTDQSVQMPPLGRTLTDPVAKGFVGAWIRTLTSCP